MEEGVESNDRKIILIIDDQPRNLQLAAHVLNPYYELILVDSGEKGLRIASEKMPDLILLDIMMPEVSGFDVCERLKKDDALKNIPIIFVTAKTEEVDILKAYELGGADYVIKPFRTRELLARVKTHLALNDQLRKNIDLSNQKDKLISAISHDLKSYSVRIKSLVEILFDEGEDLVSNPKLKETFSMLQESADKNFELLDDLMLWSRNQVNKTTLNKMEVNVQPIADKVINQLKAMIDDKNLTVKNLIPVDVQVFADVRSMEFVFRNLLSNAIKFSKLEGTITFQSTQANAHTEIEVVDNGTGMNPEKASRLFNMSQVSTTGTFGERGAGIGLQLCKDFVEQNEGTIEAVSNEGEGSIFRIRIPARKE